MSNKTIVTIGRQIGCDGHLISQMLSEKMGIPYYDKQSLKEFAKKRGLCEELFVKFDEKPPTNSLLYSLVMDPYSFGFNFDASYIPINQKVFMESADIIKSLASEGSAIFIGRCADYIIEGSFNCFKVFLYAPFEKRVENIMKQNNMKESEAKSYVNSKDKQRAAYYNYYTNKKWGVLKSYDLCLDASLLSVEGTVDVILNYIKARSKK